MAVQGLHRMGGDRARTKPPSLPYDALVSSAAVLVREAFPCRSERRNLRRRDVLRPEGYGRSSRANDGGPACCAHQYSTRRRTLSGTDLALAQ